MLIWRCAKLSAIGHSSLWEESANPFPSSHPPDIRGPSLVTEDEAWRPGGGDGVVDIIDFLSVLAEWGSGGPFDCDIDGNGIVGIGDLLHVLINWGACVDPS